MSTSPNGDVLNLFTSFGSESILDPWDCPNCTQDSLQNIQDDINYLYKKFGYKSVYTVYERLDRLWEKQFLYPNPPKNSAVEWDLF